MLEDNIKNNAFIENYMMLNFAIIAIFVENNHYEILKKLCELFKSVNRKGKIKDDMALIVSEMIKFHLRNDKNKVLELLTMIEDEMEVAKRGMRIFYEDEFAKIDAQHKKEMDVQKANFKKEFAKQKEQHARELISKEEEFARSISQKNSEIAELKLKLHTQGIS